MTLMEQCINLLKERKKSIEDTIQKHAMGRCLCRQGAGGYGASNCHYTQRRLGKLQAHFKAVIADLEARMPE